MTGKNQLLCVFRRVVDAGSAPLQVDSAKKPSRKSSEGPAKTPRKGGRGSSRRRSAVAEEEEKEEDEDEEEEDEDQEEEEVKVGRKGR